MIKFKSLEERFWSKVNIKSNNECWNWIAGIGTHGYGSFKYNGKNTGSNVMAWILTNGEIKNNLWVLHSCDNKLCCNPNHLFLGTALNNNRDMFSKGRNVVALKTNPKLAARGENVAGAKLKEFQVIEIREKLLKGSSELSIAKEYNVSPPTIRDIKSNRTWKHVNMCL